MSIQCNVIASTVEGVNTPVSELIRLGGKIAGECYLEGSFSDSKVSSDEAGEKRAAVTAKNGHHSVFGHPEKSIEITGLPKIAAMALNSLGIYETSEKSGRYTVMDPESPLEYELYNKWHDIFTQVIKEEYPGMTERNISSLAKENARYMISVFTPTSMIYTASIRQWCYISDWVAKLREEYDRQLPIKGEDNLRFHKQLLLSMEELTKAVAPEVFTDKIHDNKDRSFDFFAVQTNSPAQSISKEHYGDTYTAIYKGTVTQLAQAQRHRTIQYNMVFSGISEEFYTPVILRGTKYESEWLEDLHKVAYAFPNATIVKIIERSTAERFDLKCLERLCGRAQLEIALQTQETLLKFMDNWDGCIELKNLLWHYNAMGSTYARCKAGKDFKCTEGCYWHGTEALTRKI